MTAVSDTRMVRLAREVTGVPAPTDSRWTERYGVSVREPEDVFSWRSFRNRRGWPTAEGWHVFCGACAGVDIYVRERGISGPPQLLLIFGGVVAAEFYMVRDARVICRACHDIIKANMIERLQKRARETANGGGHG